MELDAFKKAFNMATHERKVPFSSLLETMSDEWKQWFKDNIDELPF
jgi:hypothetical protein